MHLLFWILLAVLIVVQVLILVSSVRAQQKDAARLAPRRRVLELVWALAPTILLIALLVLTWHAIATP